MDFTFVTPPIFEPSVVPTISVLYETTMMSGKPFVTLPHSGNANSAKLETALLGAAQF